MKYRMIKVDDYHEIHIGQVDDSLNLVVHNSLANQGCGVDVPFEQISEVIEKLVGTVLDCAAYKLQNMLVAEEPKKAMYELCRVFSQEFSEEPAEVILTNPDATLLEDMADFLNDRDDVFMYFVRPEGWAV